MSKMRLFFIHATAWILLLLFLPVNEWTNHGDYLKALIFELSYLPIMILMTLFTLDVIIKQFVNKQAYKSAILLSLFVLIVAAIIQRMLQYYFIYPLLMNSSLENFGGIFVTYRIVQNAVIIAAPVFISSFIKILLDWSKHRKRIFQLEQEKIANELKVLKAQLKPHFLFNNLNNIYGLSLKKSEKVSKLILKLSELLSYSLYDTSSKTVELSKEINVIKSFIDLEEIRFDNHLSLKSTIKGPFNDYQITPLILLTFVENSFKHAAKNENGKIEIDLEIEMKNSELHFNIKNSISKKEKIEEREGIGLNHSQQLLSLQYPEKHRLKINITETKFEISLWVNLK